MTGREMKQGSDTASGELSCPTETCTKDSMRTAKDMDRYGWMDGRAYKVSAQAETTVTPYLEIKMEFIYVSNFKEDKLFTGVTCWISD